MIKWKFFAALLAILFLGCENVDAEKIREVLEKIRECQPNTTKNCQCIDGSNGVQKCSEETRSWDTCVCLGTETEDCTPMVEICDGEDNDCDGATDEDAIDAVIWYKDNDGDGFGSKFSIKSCTQLGAFTALKPGDCDDTNGDIHPNAIELCDNVDNNCDGKIDERLKIEFYLDSDGDGYGTGELQTGCIDDVDPMFITDVLGDCDDNSSNIHPGAVENECDTIDSNCDGSAGDTTWLDTSTFICWQKQPIPTTTKVDAAKAYCNGLSLGDREDWALPNIDELRSLVRGCPSNQEFGRCQVTSLTTSDGNAEECQACTLLEGPAKTGCYWPEGIGGPCQSDYLTDSQIENNASWRLRYSDARIRAVDLAKRALVRCMRYVDVPTGLNLLPNSGNIETWEGSQNSALFNISKSQKLSPAGTTEVYRLEDKCDNCRSYKFSTVYGDFTVGESYTFSVWIKSADGAPLVSRLYIGESIEQNREYHSQTVDVTSSWQRFEISSSLSGIDGRNPTAILARIEPAGLFAEDMGAILVSGPQLEKGSLATKYKETVTKNLIFNSRDFTKFNRTEGVGTAGVNSANALYVDGTQEVFVLDDQLQGDVSRGLDIENHERLQIGNSVTFSIYLKNHDSDWNNPRIYIYEYAHGTRFIENSVAKHCGTQSDIWSRCSTTMEIKGKDGVPPDTLRIVINPNGGQVYDAGSVLVYGPQLENGTVATPYQSTGRAPNLLFDGDMEDPGSDYWIPKESTTFRNKMTDNPHGGARYLRLFNNGGTAHVHQPVLFPGKTYRITGFVRSDTNEVPMLWNERWIWTGTNSTPDWQLFNVTFGSENNKIHLHHSSSAAGRFTEWDDLYLNQKQELVDFIRNAKQSHLRALYPNGGNN